MGVDKCDNFPTGFLLFRVIEVYRRFSQVYLQGKLLENKHNL